MSQRVRDVDVAAPADGGGAEEGGGGAEGEWQIAEGERQTAGDTTTVSHIYY